MHAGWEGFRLCRWTRGTLPVLLLDGMGHTQPLGTGLLMFTVHREIPSGNLTQLLKMTTDIVDVSI